LTIEDREKFLTPLIFHDDTGMYVGNTFHTSITVSSSNLIPVPKWNDYTFILLLPNRGMAQMGTRQHYYYCTTEHWMERRRGTNNTIEFILPQIDDAKY
jgi:hypothetical protein